MNIMFFLTPKSDTVFEDSNSTMRQIIEKLEYHGYTAIPIIDETGKYRGTITEGDLLRVIKNNKEITYYDTEKIIVDDIPRKVKYEAASVSADIENIIKLSRTQNFVPVVDDNNVFIGIIKRSDIIDYCYNNMINKPL